ncbi:MAG TPA: hypothetical protein VGW78_02365 [Candidatus Babeliales bacterium]|jgi:hypothetical protein|nr:hypothetical protein [Candidatus Babeliales bacterium]
MRISLFIGILCSCITHFSFCATITVPFRPYPHIRKTIYQLKKTGTISHIKLSSLVNPWQVAGIFATYAGYLESSDHFGYIIFPRKQVQPVLHVLIAHKIEPIVMFEQTISHWIIVNGSPAAMYRFERISDSDIGLTYWNVQQEQLPPDNAISLDTLIIIAHPDNIYIPLGITLTDAGPNLFLPTFYTRKNIKVTDNALYMLDLAHLFGQVHLAHIKKPMYYAIQPLD